MKADEIPFLILAVLLFLLFCRDPTLATIPYRITISDPEGDLGDDTPAFLSNLDAAVADWGRFLESRGRVWIEIKVTKYTPTGRFSGGPTGSHCLRHKDGFSIFEGSGTYKLRTGRSIDDSNPDVVIRVQPDYFRAHYWIDPYPETRIDPVPRGKTDLVTVLAHELGHGFGIWERSKDTAHKLNE